MRSRRVEELASAVTPRWGDLGGLSGVKGWAVERLLRHRAGTSQSEMPMAASFWTRVPLLGHLISPWSQGESGRERRWWEAGDHEAKLTMMWLFQGDYENVTPDVPEDEGIHYSELVHLGLGERPLSQEGVEYVTLKH